MERKELICIGCPLGCNLTVEDVYKRQDQGIDLDDIYVEILSESMKRVGELWHTAEITVDTEHYCTSVSYTHLDVYKRQI